MPSLFFERSPFLKHQIQNPIMWGLYLQQIPGFDKKQASLSNFVYSQ